MAMVLLLCVVWHVAGAVASSGHTANGGPVASLTVDTASGLPTNVKLFGLNDVLGPIMQIPYDQPVLADAVQSLRVGYLRHPGGTVANYWNVSSGRYATTCSHSSVCNMSHEVNKFPEGTFSPANFVKYLAGRTGSLLPVFDLNVLTMAEDTFDTQVNTLAPFCSDQQCFVEIGNEIYLQKPYGWLFPDADAYMKTGEVLIKALRAKFPKVKISVAAGGIGSFMSADLAAELGYEQTSQEAESWRTALAKYRHLFDAVTIHDYSSVQHAQSGNNDTRTSSLATWPEVAYAQAVAFCKRLYGDDIAILVTEYNEGLSKTGEIDRDGGPHALNMLSHILAGVTHGETILAMQYHAFLSVGGQGWDYNSGMVRLDSDNASRASVNGVSQLFAHLAEVGKQSADMYRVTIGGGPRTPDTLPETLRNRSCLQAVAFRSLVSTQTLAVINRCTQAVDFKWDQEKQARLSQETMDIVTYSCGPSQAGGWVDMPSVTAQFPWPGPLRSSKPSTMTLEPLSFSIITMVQ